MPALSTTPSDITFDSALKPRPSIWRADLAELIFVMLFILIVLGRVHIVRSLSPHIAQARASENTPLLLTRSIGSSESLREAWIKQGQLASGVTLGVTAAAYLILYPAGMFGSFPDGRHALSWWLEHITIFCMSAHLLAVITAVPLDAPPPVLISLGQTAQELGVVIALLPILRLLTRELDWDLGLIGIDHIWVLAFVVVPACGGWLAWWGHVADLFIGV